MATPPSFSFGEIGGVSVAATTGTLTVENVSDAELTVDLTAVTTLDGVPSDIVSVLPTTLVIPVDGSGNATVTVTPGSGDGPGMYEGRVIITEAGAEDVGDERTVPYLFVLATFPDIGVTPSSFDETVVLQELLTETMTISNTGTGPLNFIVGAVGTGSSGDAITILETQTRSASASNTSSVDEVTSVSYTYGVLEGGPMILMYSSDHDLGAGNTYADAALQQLGLAYTGFFADPGGFSAALTGGGPWDLVVLDVPSDEPGFGDVEAYIAGGGRVIASTWDPDPSFFTAMEVNPIQSIGAPQPVYRWDTGHPIFNTPEAIPDLTSLSDDWADDGDEVEPIGTGVAIGGFTPGPTVNEAGIVIGNGNRTIMNSFLLAEVNGDDDADGTIDAIELWINESSGYYRAVFRGCPFHRPKAQWDQWYQRALPTLP